MHLISSGGLFGAEQVVLSLGGNFNQNGFVSVIGAIREKRNPHIEVLEKAKELGYPTMIMDSHGRFDLRLIFELNRFLKQNQIVLLHTHNYKSDVIGFWAAKMAGIPVVATAHGFTDTDRAVRLYEKLDRWFLRFFDRVVVVTDSVLKDFPKEKKRTINNGLDVDKYKEDKKGRGDVRKRYAIKEDEILIATVGRLSKEKNQAHLIEAAARLIKNPSHLKFLIVGGGPEEQNLKSMVEDRKLTDRIIFTGILTDMPAVYQAMDIFVLPSLTEGIPLTVLEAMASGVPVVATRVGGLPEIIQEGKTGVLVDSNDAEGLVKQLEFLTLHPEKRRTLSQEAARFVRSRFSQETMVRSYREVYEDVLNDAMRFNK